MLNKGLSTDIDISTKFNNQQGLKFISV